VFVQEIDRAAEIGSHAVFDFHPAIIGQSRERMEALFSIIAHAQHRTDIWVASCGEVAEWLLTDQFKRSADIPGSKSC
jgi:hypothetical protein